MQAARENARWCELVCSAHGASGELHATHWLDRHPVPPLYPRLVTLGGPERAREQLDATRQLVARSPGEALAVKDSFRGLELEPLGFRVLLEAEWIGLGAGAGPQADVGVLRSIAHDAEAIARWEQAWRGAPADSAGGRLFPPALLRHPEVEFVSAERGGAIVATCVLHRCERVVGLSNVGGDPEVALRTGVAAARERHTDLPVVGYESGEALRVALAAGFRSLGPLAVWARAGR